VTGVQTCALPIYDRLESAVDHPLDVEGHLLVRLHALVGHHLRVHLVTVRARLVGDEGEHDGLVALGLHAQRERRDLALRHVVGDALAVVQRAVLHPDLAGLAGDPAVVGDLVLRYRQYESIDVARHLALLALGCGDRDRRRRQK
jgi:hypothetical protein